MVEQPASSGLRLVIFNNLPPAYRIVASWAAEAGHTVALVVTSPGPSARRSTGYQTIAAQAPPEHDVLVTTRLRRVALPLIAALAPDLIISMTFPHRLPPEILRIPRLGAINLHPTALPAYRGPNPMRVFYDGATIGATLHWMDAEFDTGPILCQQTAPFPEDATTEALLGTWGPLMSATLAEGATRAIAGEPGQQQDNRGASYSPEFTEEEHWLDWDLPQRIVQRRHSGLSIFGPQAKALIEGQPWRIMRLIPLGEGTATAQAGTIIEQTPESLVIAVADGTVRVVVALLEG